MLVFIVIVANKLVCNFLVSSQGIAIFNCTNLFKAMNAFRGCCTHSIVTAVIMLRTKDSIGITASRTITTIHATIFKKTLISIITPTITDSLWAISKSRITLFDDVTLVTYSFEVVKTIEDSSWYFFVEAVIMVCLYNEKVCLAGRGQAVLIAAICYES